MGLNAKKKVAFNMDGNIPVIVAENVCLGCGASEEAVMVTQRLADIEWFTYGKWDGDQKRIRREMKQQRGLLYKGEY